MNEFQFWTVIMLAVLPLSILVVMGAALYGSRIRVWRYVVIQQLDTHYIIGRVIKRDDKNKVVTYQPIGGTRFIADYSKLELFDSYDKVICFTGVVNKGHVWAAYDQTQGAAAVSTN